MTVRARQLKFLCYVLILLMIGESTAFSHLQAAEDIVIKNVGHSAVGGKIVIHYDLVGAQGEEYSIKVVLKRKQDPTFVYKPRYLSGALGEGQTIGIGKEILWDILREYPDGLEGSDFYFSVTAEQMSSSNLLYYLLGGAAVGVGGYFLIKQKLATSTDNGYPTPPTRPGN